LKIRIMMMMSLSTTRGLVNQGSQRKSDEKK
jgi:hypothetical protein